MRALWLGLLLFAGCNPSADDCGATGLCCCQGDQFEHARCLNGNLICSGPHLLSCDSVSSSSLCRMPSRDTGVLPTDTGGGAIDAPDIEASVDATVADASSAD
jgi:hypothetical protein